MIPWKRLDRVELPDGGNLELYARGHEFAIRANGEELMGSREHGSEEKLAELGCAHVKDVAGARVLVGGLGMGFTLRATLDVLRSDARIDVAELVPAVVRWNRETLGPLANHPLGDRRVTVIEQDVRDPIRRAEGRYDAILLDVDNGPDGLVVESNDSLYGHAAMPHLWRALKPGGVLAVWSVSDDRRYTSRLRRGGFDTRTVLAPARGTRGRAHVIWIATKNTTPAGRSTKGSPRKPRKAR
ncbi:MAG: hypothetical protein R3A78_16450 [Polyangiales bacterium]|nr:hypothetical protein [Myxococcales bacterium]